MNTVFTGLLSLTFPRGSKDYTLQRVNETMSKLLNTLFSVFFSAFVSKLLNKTQLQWDGNLNPTFISLLSLTS